VVEVRKGLSVSLAALVVLLLVLGGTPGIGLVSGAAGLCCGIVLALAVARNASNTRVQYFGPADVVTLTRATLSCGVAALVAGSFASDAGAGILVALATIALLLDALDGQVARRTGTASAFGARLDGEADAFLMLVLSVYVARTAGAWVLLIGGVRYLFAMASWVLPWMRAQLPPRYWRKVVTAVAGIALTFAAAGIASAEATYAALAVAAVLLAESFGRDVWWVARQRPGATGEAAPQGPPLRLPLS
jgi:phosphatidylglycerophosphate synthase